MTLALRPGDTAPLVSDLGVDQTRDIPRRALDGYADVASTLPSVWPCTPDEERVRYYTWAARHVREARVAITAAMELLEHVAFFTNAIAGDLEDFAETGRVPHMDDIDLEPPDGDPVARILGSSRAMAGLYETALPPPTPLVRRPKPRRASTPKYRGTGPRPCEFCGTPIPRPRGYQKFCSPVCRVESHH